MVHDDRRAIRSKLTLVGFTVDRRKNLTPCWTKGCLVLGMMSRREIIKRTQENDGVGSLREEQRCGKEVLPAKGGEERDTSKGRARLDAESGSGKTRMIDN